MRHMFVRGILFSCIGIMLAFVSFTVPASASTERIGYRTEFCLLAFEPAERIAFERRLHEDVPALVDVSGTGPLHPAYRLSLLTDGQSLRDQRLDF